MRIWVKDEVLNDLLTLVNDQRGWIEVSGAIRIKEEVTHKTRNIVRQDIFAFDPVMDTNQKWVFIFKPPQALLIWGITGVFYLPEASGLVSVYPKCKMQWYWAWISNSLTETFIEEITCFSVKLVEVEWITFPGQVKKIVLLNELCRHY